MTVIEIYKEVPKFTSYAAERTRGLYNVEAKDGSTFALKADLPVDEQDWSIGVVVGPSGSGKSSIVEALTTTDLGLTSGGRPQGEPWGREWKGGRWPRDAPIIEVLSKDADYAKATAALAAVGLGSVPSWLRPKHVLSNGERFRAEMAQLLLHTGPGSRVVLDEFTSVLDRQVAKVGAGAFARSWRKIKHRQIILVTCHYDVLDWIEPDWVLDTAEGLNEFPEDRGVIEAREGSFQPDRRFEGKEIGKIQC